MTVKSWKRISKSPKGWKDHVCRPFDDYTGTMYVDSAIWVDTDGQYYLALCREQQYMDDGRGARMPTTWYEIEIGGEPPDLYNRGGYPYKGLEAFLEDMMSR
jgi:hypothetical protein